MTLASGWQSRLIAALAAALPTGAAAQVEVDRGRTFEAPARAFTLSVSNDLLYDTNVARGNEAAALRRGVEKEDIRLSPTLAVDLALPSGQALFTARASLGYEAYVRNDRLNRERVDAAFGAKLPFAICALNPELGYVRRQSDLADLAIDPLASVASTVNVQTRADAAAALTCGPDLGIRPTGFVRYTTIDNSASRRRAQNVEITGAGTGLSYVNPRVGIITAYVERLDFEYDQRPANGLLGGDRFQLTSAGLRFDRRLGAQLQLVGSLSYADAALPASLGSSERFDGLTWNLSASLRAGDRLMLALATERAIESTPGFFANFVRKTSYGGLVTYAVSPLLRATASLSRRARDFEITAIQPGLAISNDSIDSATLRFDYLRSRVRLRLDASYQRRDADRDAYDYDALLLTFGVSYVFKR
ncbi:hypothetical protein SAMN05428950_1011604 [Sphingomonas sp. OV641]|uniref:hypothetical protein n=1 Tax=Sphingomonas sp. OV641 TaxID=1881068 RepID=UPI0008B9A2D9|nr:hypothetical protein [Sphingomonas sp. OV641]SEJ25274.1 hypothetical protein SAMN05428950_1011604 [Sphingomonas sp. OV641]